MNNDEIAELLIRVDERGKRLESKFDAHAVTTEKRLDSHARDIKTLREWKMYITGGLAVITGALGLHVKAGH